VRNVGDLEAGLKASNPKSKLGASKTEFLFTIRLRWLRPTAKDDQRRTSIEAYQACEGASSLVLPAQAK
tara:strand:+ start:445 stop:651 length:207 start_codon:yes stop_codon:yes gene_type:complete